MLVLMRETLYARREDYCAITLMRFLIRKEHEAWKSIAHQYKQRSIHVSIINDFFNALSKETGRHVKMFLEENSDAMNSDLRKHLDPVSIVMALVKEFVLTSNYPKGNLFYSC